MTMKLRNRLIALVCLILFLGIGAALFLTSTSGKPFAVILFVADNISPQMLTATRLFSGGGDARLQLEDFPNFALCRNAANDFSVPDSASSSTALASGKRVNRNSLGMDPGGLKLESLLETAAAKGRSTGLVTTGRITGVTTAAYYAKTLNPDDKEDLLLQYGAHTPFDFVAGGGAKDFEGDPSTAAGKAMKQLTDKGVVILKSTGDLDAQPFWKKVPVLGLLSPGPLASFRLGEGNPDAPSLADLVRVAIKHLQSDRKGYLLVVDDPQVGDAARLNDAETTFNRLLAFDQAVSTARRYAGENSLIIVSGRENIGGLQLNGYPFLRDKGVAILALNTQGIPSISWSTGPGFASERNPADLHSKKTNAPVGILSQPTSFALPAALGTAGDVLTLGEGQGSEKLKGFLDLTDVNKVIVEKL